MCTIDVYFQIVDVPTLFKYSIIYSMGFPCANLYNTTFSTFELVKEPTQTF
jgi:hypothetical protein